MSSLCSTTLSFRYLVSVINIQTCNIRLVFLTVKSVILMNALSHKKGKSWKKSWRCRAFLLPPSWRVYKRSIYKSPLASLKSNWQPWLVGSDTPGVDTEGSSPPGSLLLRAMGVQLSLPLSQAVSGLLTARVSGTASSSRLRGLWSQSQSTKTGTDLSPVSRDGCRDHQLAPPWRGSRSTARSFAEAAVAQKANRPNIKCLAAVK